MNITNHARRKYEQQQFSDNDDQLSSEDEDDSEDERPAQLLAMFTKMFGDKKHNKPGSSKEVCNKYLAGRCTWGGKCFRQHPEGKEGSKKFTSSRKEGVRCYNCQEMGTHLAKDCDKPAKERANQVQDDKKNSEVTEGETTLSDFLAGLTGEQAHMAIHSTITDSSGDEWCPELLGSSSDASEDDDTTTESTDTREKKCSRVSGQVL